MSRKLLYAVSLVLLSAGSASAQADRYDIGRKLVNFEKAFDKQTDAAARKRAIPGLQKAFSSFMSGRLGEVGRVLDEAQWSLEDSMPDNIMRWAAPIVFRPSARLIDPKNGAFKATVHRLYDPKTAAPDNSRIRLSLRHADGSAIVGPVIEAVKELPFEIVLNSVPNQAGDLELRGEVLVGDKIVSSAEHMVSFAPDLESRLERLRTAVEKLPEAGLSTDQLSLRSHVKLLSNLAKGGVVETAYPAERLLREAEAVALMPAGGRYFEANRTGQFWLTLAGPRPAAVRLQVPESVKKGEPIPLVIAMHGAGGSENMFFDAYGHGEVARQCAKRGWLLVATRTEFFAPPPVVDVVNELAKLYPVDKAKVFLVGHSMGAGQVLSLARQDPGKWAGVAALGGGGRMVPTDAMKKLPFFIGCGTEDFAIRGAKSTAKSLMEAGVEKVEFRDYPDIEHIAIVQVALPDVFQWYDGLLTK